MTRPNVGQTPTVWNEKELQYDAEVALNLFVDRRLKEPTNRLSEHFFTQKSSILRLFAEMRKFDRTSIDPDVVRSILLNSELYDALRYVAGPPVSHDDLSVLATRSVKPVSKKRLRTDDELVSSILALMCKLADPIRFPWIAEERLPTKRELRDAILSTGALHAVQSVQTERRGYGKTIERRLESRLVEQGFEKTTAPNKGRVNAPIDHPDFPKFFGECTVYGRKVDLFIPLADRRMIALEAKDSSSALNSVKRLNNDTAAKARQFAEAGGRTIINVALLSGVFKIESLLSAQKSGLYLVWAHKMDSFLAWIDAHV